MAKAKAKLPLIGHNAHAKEMSSLMRENARRHRLSEVFSDFCELGALSISNAVDKLQFELREARYLQIVGKYEREEVERFPLMFAVLVQWLECGFADCLGDLFMGLELGDSFKGQFFTPYPVSSLMARLTVGDVRGQIEKQGFITINEPTCGAGGMVIACADAIHEQGINYQQVMHVTAQDIDATAVHMTYLQLALLHVPAIVVHGNSLTMKEWAHWVTPAHVVGGWDWRLRSRSAERDAAAVFEVPELAEAVPTAPDPAPLPATQAAEPMTKVRRAIVDQRLEQISLFD